MDSKAYPYSPRYGCMPKSEWFNTRLSKWTVQSQKVTSMQPSAPMLHQQECHREGSTSPIIPTGALLMAAQHSLIGARATNPQLKGSPAQQGWTWTQLKAWPVPMPCPWLEDLGALGVSEITGRFFLCYLPEKASTQHSSAALHIPPPLLSSRRHQSCLYYQDFSNTQYQAQ